MSLTRKPLRRFSHIPGIPQIERELEANLALGFWQETVRHPCRVCGSHLNLEAHHVIAKSVLKRELASKGRPCPRGFIWDPRNGLSLCSTCHQRFTNRALTIHREQLAPAHFEFAADHGLTWRLERDYPEQRAEAA